jgi:hypothetical protein
VISIPEWAIYRGNARKRKVSSLVCVLAWVVAVDQLIDGCPGTDRSAMHRHEPSFTLAGSVAGCIDVDILRLHLPIDRAKEGIFYGISWLEVDDVRLKQRVITI